MVKNLPANAGDLGLIPGSGRSPGEVNGNPPQYSCLENSMDNGTWWTIVQGVSKSWTRLSDEHFKSFVSLLIFHLDNLSIDISGVLKSPAIIVLLLISPFMFVSIVTWNTRGHFAQNSNYYTRVRSDWPGLRHMPRCLWVCEEVRVEKRIIPLIIQSNWIALNGRENVIQKKNAGHRNKTSYNK